MANHWEQFGSNCYKLHHTLRKSWISARSECLKEGADLVSIESAEEEQYVLGLDPSTYDLWLGYSTLVRVSFIYLAKKELHAGYKWVWDSYSNCKAYTLLRFQWLDHEYAQSTFLFYSVKGFT